MHRVERTCHPFCVCSPGLEAPGVRSWRWQGSVPVPSRARAEWIHSARVNWHGSTWANAEFGRFSHLLGEANLFWMPHVRVWGLELSLPGGEVLPGPSGEKLPIPASTDLNSTACPSLAFIFFPSAFSQTLLDVIEKLREAKQELMTSAGIIQHSWLWDCQPCSRRLRLSLTLEFPNSYGSFWNTIEKWLFSTSWNLRICMLPQLLRKLFLKPFSSQAFYSLHLRCGVSRRQRKKNGWRECFLCFRGWMGHNSCFLTYPLLYIPQDQAFFIILWVYFFSSILHSLLVIILAWKRSDQIGPGQPKSQVCLSYAAPLSCASHLDGSEIVPIRYLYWVLPLCMCQGYKEVLLWISQFSGSRIFSRKGDLYYHSTMLMASVFYTGFCAKSAINVT